MSQEASFGIPVSTTHSISGAIMGTGASKRFSAVRWPMAKRIVYAWIITIPASAAVAAMILIVIDAILKVRF